MDYLNQKKGFLGYEADNKIDNKVVVVPFGLEKSVSYGGGTKNGPKEIIKASHQVELFDEDLDKEPYKHIGIKTLKSFPIKKKLNEAINQLAKINEKIISRNKFPLIVLSLSSRYIGPSVLYEIDFFLISQRFDEKE